MKEIFKFVCVDLVPAMFVAFLGFVAIVEAPTLAKFITSELAIAVGPDLAMPEDRHFWLAVLIVCALVGYAVARFIFDVSNYGWFRFFGSEKPACGLYIEAYFTIKEEKALPAISLIVVYFDARTEKLKIEGHSFIQGEEGNPKFLRHASWQSKALYFEPKRNDFDIFYIHEGEVVNLEKHIRGTTTFDLPSGKNTRQGSFCDLKALQRDRHQPGPDLFAATHFDIIRASDEIESVFCGKIKNSWARWLYRRMLCCPREETFSDFINERGRDLLKDVQEMTPVWNALK